MQTWDDQRSLHRASPARGHAACGYVIRWGAFSEDAQQLESTPILTKRYGRTPLSTSTAQRIIRS